jgi:N-acetylmuramoyl-L-alanine amidase
MTAKRCESTLPGRPSGAIAGKRDQYPALCGSIFYMRKMLDRGCFRVAAMSMAAALCLFATHREAAAQSRGILGVQAAAVDAPAPPLPTQAPALGGVRQRAVATNAHLEDGVERAKLTFELSNPVKAAAFTLAEPDRIVIELPEINFRVDPQAGAAIGSIRRGHAASRGPVRVAGLVASFRFGFFTAGKSRIVIDLAAPARVVRAESEKSADGSKTFFVVELVKTDQAQFRRSVQTATEAAAHAPVRAAEVPPSNALARKAVLPTIAIDAGHGGVDSGAMANGLIEKTLVFEFTKALEAKLQATGHFKVVMTRDSDTFVPLSERVRIARDAQAQLFVSIHADMLVESAAVSGATVYTVSDRASDVEAARTAEKENQADAAAGLDRQDDATDVSDILFDLTRRETRAYSHVFARTLVNYWKVAGRLNKNPERAAGFRVLKAPDVPSVLVELGYVSNEKDAASFASTEWREKTTEKIVEAIEAFFAARGAGPHADTAPDESKSSRPPAIDHARDPAPVLGADLALRGDLIENVAGRSQ